MLSRARHLALAAACPRTSVFYDRVSTQPVRLTEQRDIAKWSIGEVPGSTQGVISREEYRGEVPGKFQYVRLDADTWVYNVFG